jgi:hypothetical protein
VTRPLAFAAPIFLSLTLHRRRLRVLDLQPIFKAARVIGRAEPLRHNALASEPASLLEDDRAVAIVVIIEADAITFPELQVGQGMLSLFDRFSAHVPAVKLDQVAIASPAADKIKDRQPALIDGDHFTVDEARAHGQGFDRFDDFAEAVAENSRCEYRAARLGGSGVP